MIEDTPAFAGLPSVGRVACLPATPRKARLAWRAGEQTDGTIKVVQVKNLPNLAPATDQQNTGE